jgi:hypothetical protein
MLTIAVLLLPIKSMLIMVGVLAFTDLFTGILAAKKQGRVITSQGLRKTISKLLVYEVALIFGFLIEKYLMDDIVPITKVLGVLIGVTELKSLFENLDTISGDSLLQVAIKQVVMQSGLSEADIKKTETPVTLEETKK